MDNRDMHDDERLRIARARCALIQRATHAGVFNLTMQVMKLGPHEAERMLADQIADKAGALTEALTDYTIQRQATPETLWRKACELGIEKGRADGWTKAPLAMRALYRALANLAPVAALVVGECPDSHFDEVAIDEDRKPAAEQQPDTTETSDAKTKGGKRRARADALGDGFKVGAQQGERASGDPAPREPNSDALGVSNLPEA